MERGSVEEPWQPWRRPSSWSLYSTFWIILYISQITFSTSMKSWRVRIWKPSRTHTLRKSPSVPGGLALTPRPHLMHPHCSAPPPAAWTAHRSKFPREQRIKSNHLKGGLVISDSNFTCKWESTWRQETENLDTVLRRASEHRKHSALWPTVLHHNGELMTGLFHTSTGSTQTLKTKDVCERAFIHYLEQCCPTGLFAMVGMLCVQLRGHRPWGATEHLECA